MASPITYTFPNFPLVNQLSLPPGDHYPDVNEQADCVPASLSAGVTYLLAAVYYANQLKDVVYGNAYQGATDPGQYASYLSSLGVTMTPYTSGDGNALVAHIHAALQAGRPVAISMPSQWGIPYSDPVHPSGPTHEAIACGYGPGWLRMMNPWGGFFHDGSDAYWAARLTYGIVWDLALKAGQAVTTGVPAGWSDDGTTLKAPNGLPVVAGFRNWVLAHAWNPDDFPMAAEAEADQVEPDWPSEKGTRQFFREHLLIWTPTKGVYESWVGANLFGLVAQVADLQAQLAAAKNVPTPAPAPVDALAEQAKSLVKAIYQLGGQL